MFVYIDALSTDPAVPVAVIQIPAAQAELVRELISAFSDPMGGDPVLALIDEGTIQVAWVGDVSLVLGVTPDLALVVGSSLLAQEKTLTVPPERVRGWVATMSAVCAASSDDEAQALAASYLFQQGDPPRTPN